MDEPNIMLKNYVKKNLSWQLPGLKPVPKYIFHS